MSARRKIAGGLRWLAARVDDRPRVAHEQIDARVAAMLAVPRQINRYATAHFSNGRDDCQLSNPLVIAAAHGIEQGDPGCYAGNPDMLAAILRYRANGGV